MPTNQVTPTVGPAVSAGTAQKGLDTDTAHHPTLLGQEFHHELRTQLAAITLLSGNLDLLYERLDDEQRRKLIKDLRRHTHALNDLAGELLLQNC